MTGRHQQPSDKEHLLGKHMTKDKLNDVILLKKSTGGVQPTAKRYFLVQQVLFLSSALR